MNKDILGYIALFSVVSMIGIILAVILYGVNNDYVISEVYDVSEVIHNNELISDEIFTSIDASANEYSQVIDYFDWYWLLFYITFIGATIGASYYSKQEDEFSFLTTLFYGTMVILFLFSIMDVLTDWFSSEVLYNLVPNLNGAFPMFDTWLNSAGIFSFIHMLFCILANKVDLKLADSNTKKGVEFTDTDEVL